MNTIILEAKQLISADCAELSARQDEHIDKVLRGQEGDRLQVGVVDGMLGSATLRQGPRVNNTRRWQLVDLCLDTRPPPQAPVTLILALPRPQMFKRSLQAIACFGVKHLLLLQTQRVEKSYWQSPCLQPEAIREQLILGLEQAVATQLPKVSFFRAFRPFIEDHCPTITRDSRKILLHPNTETLLSPPTRAASTPSACAEDLSLAIGPEGGFTNYECDRFIEAGFELAHLGARILKVETAVVAALGRLLG